MGARSASDVRKNFAEAVTSAQVEPVVIERRGRREAVLIAPEFFDELLQAADELADIAAFDRAMQEEGENIPWEQVKADLDWA